MKIFVALLLALLSLNAHSQIPDYVPTDGLVVCYLLDGNAADASGNGNSGAIAGNVYSTTDRFGNSSGAMRFNGGCSDRIDANVNTASISGAMSFGFWVQRNGNGCISPRILEFWSGTNGNGTMQWNWSNSTSGPSMSQHQTASSNAVSSDFGNASVANNTWVHCTYTNDGVEAKFYLDGVLVDSKPAASGNIILAGDLALGRMNHPAWDAFNGSLDEVVLYNRALTISEVLTLSNSAPLVVGCTDASACNFNPEANSDDGTCVPSGCMDAQACNYNADAECEGEACDYTCCPGPGCCDVGMQWDWEIGMCQITNPSDSNFDGCVELSDLLDLLAKFGNCDEGVGEIEYSVGDEGPAGGVVFFVDEDDLYPGWTYLEAAPADIDISLTWGSWYPGNEIESLYSGLSDEIGDGLANSERIWFVLDSLQDGSGNPAAQACRQHSAGNADDWFLGSLGEMELLRSYAQTTDDSTFVLEPFDTSVSEYSQQFQTGYWSSSLMDNYAGALSLFFMNTGICGCAFFEAYWVRPIRRF